MNASAQHLSLWGVESAHHRRGFPAGCRKGDSMGRITRRDMMTYFGLGSAAIALAEAGLLTPANAAREFTWASTGGSWGEHLDNIFVKKGGFAEKTHLAPAHSFQLETVAASK